MVKYYLKNPKILMLWYLDALGHGYGGYAICNQQKLVCQGSWTENEKVKSSTWWEI